MSVERESFTAFLQELGLADIDGVMAGFEHYHRLLSEYNQMVNLVSRAMPVNQYWTKHFLDSLLPLKCMDLSEQSVLDFGSGGGLPGIPLKLVHQNLRIHLLDSVGKKTRILAEMVSDMHLEKVEVINARLEDFAEGEDRFDLVFCRALKMEERYRQPLWQLLKPGGSVIFYKAQDSEDLKDLAAELMLEQSFDWGSRKIWRVKRKHLKPFANRYRKHG